MRTIGRTGLALALVACAAGRIHAQPPALPQTDGDKTQDDAPPSKAPQSGLEAAAALEDVLVRSIAACEQSVVSIARVAPVGPELDVPDLRAQRFGPPAPDPTDPNFVPNEFATGVIVDVRGLILTNSHVVDADSDHWITTTQRKVYFARILADDPRADLAVLEVGRLKEGGFEPITAYDPTRKFEPIRFGDGDTLRKGQIVIALGNPYAIARDGQASASWGIVANLSRKIGPDPSADERVSLTPGKETLHHFGGLIQTDARLNQGTSGGPLLNLRGEMVGLTTSVAALSGYEQAAGYAIPVNEAFHRSLEVLKRGQEVEYGFLGIVPSNLRAGDDKLPRGLTGVLVNDVRPGMPARAAQVLNGDIITAVDGRPVFDTDSLLLAVGSQPPGKEVTLDIFRKRTREGGELTSELIKSRVTLSKSPSARRPIVTERSPAWRGMRVDYATSLLEIVRPDRRAGRDVVVLTDDPAVAVSEVAEGSAAWTAGLRRGQLVSHVATSVTATPAAFERAVGKAAGPVVLVVIRSESRNPVKITVGL